MKGFSEKIGEMIRDKIGEKGFGGDWWKKSDHVPIALGFSFSAKYKSYFAQTVLKIMSEIYWK